jgi:hypothetical protein
MVQNPGDTPNDAARLVADAIRAGRLPKKPSLEQLSRIASVIRPVLAASAQKKRAKKAA